MKILVACVHCVLYVALVGFCLYIIGTTPHTHAIIALPLMVIGAMYSEFLYRRFIVPLERPTAPPKSTTVAAE